MKKLIIVICFSLFILTIPAANYMLLHVGTICNPNSPCIIPVWFSPLIYAPSGVVFAGLAFVLRDILQRLSSLSISLLAVILGTIINYIYLDPILAIAGATAYALSEITDTYIYSYLQKYNLLIAILISSSAGLLIDSLIFLHLAFHSFNFLAGQIIGKLLMVLISIPIVALSRKLIRY